MKIKPVFLAMACAAPLVLSGCFDRKEEIAVTENGNASIHISFDGTVDQYPPSFELPLQPPWQVAEKKIEKLEDGTTEITIAADMIVPYGEKLPDRYDFSGKEDQGLRFPGEIKITRKGRRTFYEFSRRYQSRKYFPYSFSYEFEIDKKLEEKILDAGIFNVEEKERVKYLNQLTSAFLSSEIHFFDNVLGRMVLDNDISQSVREEMFDAASDGMRARFTPYRFRQILTGSNEAIERDYTALRAEVDQLFASIFKGHIPRSNFAAIGTFTRLLQNERRAYQITGAVYGQDFSVALRMPGHVVVTNGLIEDKDYGKVIWHFKGSNLADCEYILHAISIVED